MPKAKLFDSKSDEAFKISRSGLDLFFKCPRCFYLNKVLGIKHPSMPGFSLNSAVDHLLKKEFDIHRAVGEPHPLFKSYGLKLIPFQHEKMDEWRENFIGIQYLHKPTNLLITGAIDDIWVDEDGTLYIVDYKSTSTKEEITLDGEYKEGYKRQMEIYQWLFRQNGFKVSDTGYFVYANGRKDPKAFDGKLEFDVEIIPYKGDTKWVEGLIKDAHKCLMGKNAPKAGEGCEYCRFVEEASKI